MLSSVLVAGVDGAKVKPFATTFGSLPGAKVSVSLPGSPLLHSKPLASVPSLKRIALSSDIPFSSAAVAKRTVSSFTSA